MKLIDGDALKAKFCNHCDERDCKPDATDTVYGCVIADTIDNMPTIEAEPVDDWISVKDRLPPYGERVLVINEAYGAEHRYTKYNIGVTVRSPHLDFTFWGHKVTHWQPLPKPPKGGRL